MCLDQAATSSSLSETNTEVIKTAILRLAARGWLQKGAMLKCPTLQQKKYVYSLVPKVVLVHVANFALRDNCEGSDFFYNSSV